MKPGAKSGGFFGQGPSRNLTFQSAQNSTAEDKGIKERNKEHMVSIRRENRRDAIKNARYQNNLKNLARQQNLQPGQGPVEIPSVLGEFPRNLSHLNKVKEAHRIHQIIKSLHDAKVNPEELPMLLSRIKDKSRLIRHEAIIRLRKLLSIRQGLPIQETIDLNGVPVLIEMAQDSSELHLRLEATWCLANLVSGNSAQTNTMVQKNIIGLFQTILNDPYPQIVEQAIWGLGNIIGDCVTFRNKVVKAKVLPQLIRLLKKFKDFPNVKKNIIWCLSNACRIKPSKEKLEKMEESVDTLIHAFNTSEEVDVKNDCLLGFSEFCRGKFLKKFTNEVFLANLRTYYQYLYTTCANYIEIKTDISSIHKIIGNITNGDDFDTNKILDAGFLLDLNKMLHAEDTLCKREICWILSNIGAGTSGQIQAILMEPGLFDNLIGLLSQENKHIQRESLWTICNMTRHCNEDQLKFLISNNILSVFAELIGMDKDVKMIVLVLEALPNMFDRGKDSFTDEHGNNGLVDLVFDCGLADKIQELQRHPSDHIYEKVIGILEQYFDLEEF